MLQYLVTAYLVTGLLILGWFYWCFAKSKRLTQACVEVVEQNRKKKH